MSKSDFPPGYDDSRAPLYNGQGGDYPPPPSYGFSPYGGQPQSGPYPGAQPSAPYSGQPSGQPSGPYPGQPGGYPNAGPMPGQGYPPHGMPTMPNIIPPSMPSEGKFCIFPLPHTLYCVFNLCNALVQVRFSPLCREHDLHKDFESGTVACTDVRGANG